MDERAIAKIIRTIYTMNEDELKQIQTACSEQQIFLGTSNEVHEYCVGQNIRFRNYKDNGSPYEGRIISINHNEIKIAGEVIIYTITPDSIDEVY